LVYRENSLQLHSREANTENTEPQNADRDPRATNQRALNQQKNKHRTLSRWLALKEIQRGTAVIEPHGDETQ